MLFRSVSGTLTPASLNLGSSALSVTGTVTGGNLLTTGLISATGAITGLTLNTSGNITTQTFLNANTITATNNILCNNQSVIVSNTSTPRKITVSSGTPTGGNIGDIWYQTY